MPRKLSNEKREILKKQIIEKKIKAKNAENLWKKKGKKILIPFFIIQLLLGYYIIGVGIGLVGFFVVYNITGYIIEKRIANEKLKDIYSETITTCAICCLLIYGLIYLVYI